MEIDLDNNEFHQVETLLNHTSASVFMTGKAGTGKSTFLKYITQHTRKKFVVLAPTGIAAVNAGGQTLHSFFHIPFKPLLPDDPEFASNRLSQRMKYSKTFVRMLRSLDLIIIDEISMVRADIIDFIDRILRHYCTATLPFGGKQLLMVGDVFQLEPVVTAQARDILRLRYPNFYFFSAEVFADFEIVPIELRKVYRQTDADFVALLDRVRAGSPRPDDLAAINARVVPKAAEGEADAEESAEPAMTIATRRDIVDYINDTRLQRIDSPARTYEATVKEDFPESSFPTDKSLTLKRGAQVVFIRNDPEGRWVNGTIGHVESMADESLVIRLENGKSHKLEREVWENVEYGYDEEKRSVTETVKGLFIQFPVKLAWALTIHKSQGLTFSRIIIDVGQYGAFTGGQSYVALSRCTSLDGITMASPMRDRDIYVSAAVSNFAREFNNPVRVTDALRRARADELYAEAARHFDAGRFSLALESFAEAVDIRNDLTKRVARRIIAAKLHRLNEPVRHAEALQRQINAMQLKLNRLADEYVELGRQCLDEAYDCQAAVANFRKALDLNPESYEAQYELGSYFMSCGDLDQAKACLKAAHRAAPAVPEILDTLADLYDILDEPDQARRFRAHADRLRRKKK